MDICLQCGDKETANAFVYCVSCLDCALHRYCMEVVTFDEFIPWICDDCEVILQKQPASQNCDAVAFNKWDHTVSEDIKVLSEGELKKCVTLAREKKRHIYEEDLTRKSSETCIVIALAASAKSASGTTPPIAEKCQHGSGKKMKKALFCEANSEEHGRNSNYADPNVSPVPDLHVPAAIPVIIPIWRGSFNIQNKDNGILDEFVAHLSSKACQKVFDEASQFQGVLHLEMLPKSRVWPKSFETSQPSDDSIALYFFPSDTRYERIFDHLVEEMMSQGLAMKAILSNAELLVFTSLELPSQYWRFQCKYYLWGVFRGKQVSSSHHLTDSIRGDKPILYSDCSKDMDVNRGKNAMKTKNWDAPSPLRPFSNDVQA